MDPRTPKQRYLSRGQALLAERSSWVGHWQEISRHLHPRAGRFFSSDRNLGDKRHNQIYDNTGIRALKILGAGLMSGATSPARPWFSLKTADPDLMDNHNVKRWTSDVTRMILTVFARSNTYRSLHSQYEELGAFGTGATILMDDFETVTHDKPLTVGEYCLGTNYKGVVDTVYREFELTVAQMVEEFGYDACSVQVRNQYDTSNYDKWVKVAHIIQPRRDREYGKKDARNKPWASCYMEMGGDDQNLLRESGYDDFPALCPRWETHGGDVYGSSPGMAALGDIKQLQHEQLRKAEGIDYMTKPPLQAPTSMKNQETRLLPGGISYVDSNSPTGGIRSAFEVNLRLDYLLEDIRDVRERINSGFYVDMFLMLANDTRSGVTATEVAERHEEKLLMLGPVLERLHNEDLQPRVEMTFARLLRAGALPPPPEELQGQDLNVEFVSILAQAQRAVATNGVDRFVGNLGTIAAFKPDVLDKFNADEWADKYSDMLGVDPELIVPAEQVALVRQQRAEQQAQAQRMAMAEQAATAANKMANSPTQGGSSNALTDVLGGLQGYRTPASGLQ